MASIHYSEYAIAFIRINPLCNDDVNRNGDEYKEMQKFDGHGVLEKIWNYEILKFYYGGIHLNFNLIGVLSC